MLWDILLALAVAYLLGSIPTAYLLGRWAKGIDIRQHGSGNVGATNALRVLGTKLGVLCLVLDLLKGWTAVALAARLLAPHGAAGAWALAGAGLTAIAGHIYTVWLDFKGGKGVASTIGVFLALQPLATLGAAVVGVAAIWASRWVALGSLVIAALIPALAAALALARDQPLPTPSIALGVALAVTIFVKHRGNIQRMLAGNERRIGESAAPAPPKT